MGKKIITIAEIIFAIVFIIIMALLFNTVTNFGDSANESLTNIKQSIEDADIASYNNTTVSGDTVVSTINKLKTTKNGVKLSYYVDLDTLADNSFGYCTIKSGNGAKVLDSDGKELSGYTYSSAETTYVTYKGKAGNTSEFISPVENYTSKLAFNENGVLIGMIFEKV